MEASEGLDGAAPVQSLTLPVVERSAIESSAA
jgi:hypothetical protein